MYCDEMLMFLRVKDANTFCGRACLLGTRSPCLVPILIWFCCLSTV